MTPDGPDLNDRGTDRRKFLLGGLFAASAAVTYARLPRKPINYLGSRKLESLIPKKVGGWEFVSSSGLVVPPEDPLSDSLYSNLVTRVYNDGTSPPVMLLIAQSSGQTGLLQVHRPEVCYPAGGYALSPIITEDIPTTKSPIRANRLTATLDSRVEQILYWTRVGNRMPASWRDQRLAVAIDNLKGMIPDAALVRVSTIDPDGEAAFARLNAFIGQLINGVSPDVRRVLVA